MPQDSGDLHRHAVQHSAVANLGAIALSGASLDFLLRHVADTVADVLSVDFTEIVRVQPDGRFITVQGSGWDEGVIGSEKSPLGRTQAELTLALRAPVVSDDVTRDPRYSVPQLLVRHQVRSGVTVPVAGSGEPWGILGVYSRTQRRFMDSDVDFLRSVASVLGQAIERARVEIELRIRATQQSAIAELGRLAFHSLDPSTLARACELVQNGLGVEYAYVLERENEAELRIAAGNLIASREDCRPITISSDTQAGLAALQRRPIVVSDYLSDERFQNAQVRDYEIRSGISVPIASASNLDGVLCAFSRLPRAFTPADVHFMEALAHTLSEAAERRRTTTALIESEERYRSVFEGASEIIFEIEASGIILALNQAFETILGYPRHEWIGRDFREILAPDEVSRIDALFCAGLASQRPFLWETKAIRPDGMPVEISVSLSPKLQNGRVVTVHGFARDVTESRQLEAKLEQANRVASLGKLAATVAHEFNNVLMGISPFVEVLQRTTTPEKIAMSVEHIGRSVRRGRRITQDILRFTQPARPVLAEVDVRSWLEPLALEAQSLIQVQYKLEFEAEPLRISADAAQLHQIFLNMILNARDAMTDGGTIRIDVRREPAEARFRFGVVDDPSAYAHFIVSDSGCGMSEETMRHALEPLFTTKKNGTGLGLAVTHQVVKRHHGELFVESAVDKGTSFHVFLPLVGRTEE